MLEDASSPRWATWLALAVAQLGALLLLLEVVRAPIDGEWYERQALVQAQIEKAMRSGDLFRGGTYNLTSPPVLFEGPLFQGAVCATASFLDADALVVARCLNIALFFASLWTFLALSRALGFGEVRVALAGVLVCASPLLLHYQSVPLSDGLAIFSSLLALWGYVRLADLRSSTSRFTAWAALIVGGVAAAFVKCTVGIPAAGAAAAHAWSGGRWRTGAALPLASFAAVSVVGLIAHLWMRAHVNAGAPILNESASWLFGSLEERFTPSSWRALARPLLELVLPTPLALLAVAGCVALLIRRGADPARAVLLGWGFASGAYLLVFFPLHVKHSYYLLPFVFPAAACAAAVLPAGELVARRTRPRGGFASAGLLSASAAAGAVFAGSIGLAELRSSFTAQERARGAWIQASTEPRDFVIYLTKENLPFHDHPLYVAHRDGVPIALRLLEIHGLESIYSIFLARMLDAAGRAKYRRICIYAPAELVAPTEELLGDVPQLDLLRSRVHGDLYVYRLQP